MQKQQFIADDERPVRTVRRDGSERVVADLGLEAETPTVDVVDDTVIVARDAEEFDVEFSSPVETAFIRNGVLTIEIEADS